MDTQPSEIILSSKSKDAFATTYGIDWESALPSMMSNPEALDKLGVDGASLETMWRTGVTCKLAPGTYVSRLEGPSDTIFTVNGFYPAMRQAFVAEGAEVRYLVCEFDEAKLSWQSFRRDVIGATNPADAAPGSARAEMLKKWSDLGLTAAPTMSENCVHASAGPLEGLKERCVWSGASLETDELAKALIAGGIELSLLEEWLADNPVVTLGGETDKIFDLTEEMGTDAALELCLGACVTN